MRLKHGVSLVDLQPQMVVALLVLERVYQGLCGAQYELTITSGKDGKHMAASLHYRGLALDTRTSDVPAGKRETLARNAQLALGDEFDVVLEKDHLHTEFDPD